MPKMEDKIDVKAAEEMLEWWDQLPPYQRKHIGRNIRGLWTWLVELRDLARYVKSHNIYDRRRK